MKPELEQLREVIKNADDRKPNSLILNFDGTFEIPVEYGINVDSAKSYIIRFETFDYGNGYVGVEASKDDDFLNRLLKTALEAWDCYQTNPNYKNNYIEFF